MDRPAKVCRLCGELLPDPLLDLGIQTLANNLVVLSNGNPPVAPLALCVCRRCGLVQLTHVVDPELLFSEYLYEPRFSETFQNHFDDMAAQIDDIVPRRDAGRLIVDIGSNDGTLLNKFQSRGWRVCGVEPSERQVEFANAHDIHTLEHFWGELARQQVEAYFGRADIITATNVFAHVDDLHSFMDEVTNLLRPKGMLIIEVPYLYDMFKQGTFDLIYHEHLSYFHLLPMESFFNERGMEIVRVERVDMHGGSIRVFVAREDEIDIHPGERDILTAAEYRGKGAQQELKSFARACEKKRNALRTHVYEAIEKGKKIVGYTAPAKATVMINYCGFSSYHLDYIVDDNPAKVGKYLPGSGIQVVASSKLEESPPDVIIVFAWNIVSDILPKLPPAEVITAMPELKVWNAKPAI